MEFWIDWNPVKLVTTSCLLCPKVKEHLFDLSNNSCGFRCVVVTVLHSFFPRIVKASLAPLCLSVVRLIFLRLAGICSAIVHVLSVLSKLWLVVLLFLALAFTLQVGTKMSCDVRRVT